MRENLLKKQPTWGLRRAQGTGQKSATPATLTKIILVLLTMLLLPNAAWGQAHDFYVKIGGTKVSANNNEITGEGISFGENGFISYSHDESTGTGTLTLKNATINYTGNEQALITSNTVDKLIIELRGNNIIQTTQNVNAISGNITLKSNYTVIEFTSTTQDGSLLLENKATDANTAVISSTVTINGDSYKNGLEPRIIYFTAMSSLTFATKAVIAIPYGISIAGVEVTSANNTNILDDANKTVSFTPANATTSPATPATLTLKGASISGGGIYTTLENLEIDLVNTNTNTNTIETSGSKNGIVSTTNTGTLTFTGTGSLEISSDCSVIRGFTAIEGLNLETKTPYEIYNNGYYRLKDKAAADSTGVKWLKVIQQATYPLWIAGTQVTEVNASNITGTGITVLGSTEEGGGISFSNTDNQLTLKNVTIDYSNTFADPIISSIENLKVKLIGINKINIANTSYCGFKYTGTNGTLTFVDPTSFSEIGQLTVFKSGSSLGDANLCSGYTISNQFESSGDEYFTPQNSGWTKITQTTDYVKVRYVELYNLWIGGARISSNNLIGNGYQNYDPETSSIKYSGATSSARIVSNLPELTIILSGENSLNVTDGTDPAISFTASEKTPTGKLIFTKDKNTTSTINRMTIDCANGAIVGFSEVTTDDPLKLSVPTTAPATWDNSTTKVVITDETLYDLWVEGIRVTSENMDNVKGEYIDPQIPTTPSVVFDGTSTLTLTNATISVSGGNAIESGLANLTVDIEGESNSIMCNGTNDHAFKATGSSNKITFTTTSNEAVSLSISGGLTPIEGFDTNYGNGLGLLYSSTDQKYSIETLETPVITRKAETEGGITVELSLPDEDDRYSSNTTMYYSITYSDETIDFAEYSSEFNMVKPGTVTAYLVPLGGKSNNAVAKYYGYPDAPYTMAVDDELTPEIYPAIDENDGIGLFNTSSGDEDIASFTYSDGIVKAIGIGSTTLTAIYSAGDLPFTVLNPIADPQAPHEFTATFSVIVGGSLSDYFEGSNNFGTFYNTDQTTTYAVPAGMKAYVITGADPKTGKVTTAETTVLPPNTPVLMEKGSAKAFTYIPATSGTAPSNNILLYTGNTDVQASEGSNLYVLYNDKFVKVTTGTRILSQKSYLKLNTSSGTRSYYDIDGSDGTTGIRDVKSEGVKGEKLADGAWHDLQGRKFTTKPTKPGLYILNGKKIVVK